MNNDLKHYGILGMRWGRRRAGGARAVSVGPGLKGKLKEIGGLAKDAARDDLNKARGIAKSLSKSTTPDPDFARVQQIKKKPVSKLSNDELRTAITRLQLEKQYKDLNNASVGKGKRFVKDLLTRVVGMGINSYARTQVDPRFVDIFSQAKKKARGSGS